MLEPVDGDCQGAAINGANVTRVYQWDTHNRVCASVAHGVCLDVENSRGVFDSEHECVHSCNHTLEESATQREQRGDFYGAGINSEYDSLQKKCA
jgi:hypothetical protein